MCTTQDRNTTFVALHYTDEAGGARKLRASPEHLVFLAPTGMAPGGRPAPQLPPGGAATRADMVRVGDLLAVRSAAEEGGFYAARVTAVTRWAAGTPAAAAAEQQWRCSVKPGHRRA